MWVCVFIAAFSRILAQATGQNSARKECETQGEQHWHCLKALFLSHTHILTHLLTWGLSTCFPVKTSLFQGRKTNTLYFLAIAPLMLSRIKKNSVLCTCCFLSLWQKIRFLYSYSSPLFFTSFSSVPLHTVFAKLQRLSQTSTYFTLNQVKQQQSLPPEIIWRVF